MNPANERIRELALKWTNGTISEEEREEFLLWYNNADNGEPLHIPGQVAKNELIHSLRLLSNIYREAGIIEQEDEETAPIIPIYRRAWIRYVALFILLVGAGALVYQLNNEKPKQQIIVQTPVEENDVKAPSSVQAMVVFDDGKQIVLDSLAKGPVRVNNGAEFLKVEEGEIVYTPATTDKQVFSTLINPRGSRVIQVTLADGTKVWLNSESSIRYPNVFAGNRREVEVTGQSYFEVAKNVNAPFIVRTSNMQVEVLGTHFDINAYRDEENLAVTLLEGSVRVSNDNFDALELKPREQTQLNHAGKLSKHRNVDIEKVVAWKNGKFDFGSKTDLNTILRQITRWYNIELESGVPGNKYYGGSISRDVNLSEVLKVLETAGDIKFSVRENKLRVLQ